jgi:hypothetical protein
MSIARSPPWPPARTGSPLSGCPSTHPNSTTSSRSGVTSRPITSLIKPSQMTKRSTGPSIGASPISTAIGCLVRELRSTEAGGGTPGVLQPAAHPPRASVGFGLLPAGVHKTPVAAPAPKCSSPCWNKNSFILIEHPLQVLQIQDKLAYFPIIPTHACHHVDHDSSSCFESRRLWREPQPTVRHDAGSAPFSSPI